MNKFIISFFTMLFCLSLNVFSQTDYIILWDVTWSMKGCIGYTDGEPDFDQEKNIWDETKLLLKDVIMEIPLNGKSNVKIIPFQDPIRTKYDGKVIERLNISTQKELLDYVENFKGVTDKSEATGTNICKVIEDVYKSMTDQANTTLLIFSDGEQSKGIANYSDDCLLDLKSKFCTWCNKTDEMKKMYIYELKELNTRTGKLNNPCECVITTYSSDCKMTIFTTLNPINSNLLLSYEKNNNLVISFNNQSQLPPLDFKIRVKSSNSRIYIEDKDFIYSNQSITIPLIDLDIEEGNTESTVLSFEGVTDEACYSFTILPLNLSIIRKELAIIKIGKIIVK